MVHKLDHDEFTGLERALSGHYRVPLGEHVTLICTDLPAGCPSAAVRDGDHLLVIVDLTKADAHGHARAMLREWSGRNMNEPCDLAEAAFL